MEAAVALVTEHRTANVAVSDIAEAAGVSRQLIYLHYGDRDTLLLEAALDLARRQLVDRWSDGAELVGRERALAAARHFAEYRVFYRAILTSASAFALNKALGDLLAPINRRAIEARLGGILDERQVGDLAVFVTGGGGAVINTWLIEAEDPLDPEDFADRLLAVGSIINGALDEAAAAQKETT